MKKVLYIVNDALRKFTYEIIAGLDRAIQRAEEPINLYIMRSDGFPDFAPAHNQGEFNIFRLPNYADYDGIILDINNNVETDAMSAAGLRYAYRAAAESGRPVISMSNYVEDFYYVGIDNYGAMQTVIRHLHEAMGLTDFWFAMGPDDYETGMRTSALKDYCRDHGLPCEDERFYAESYALETGVHAFRHFLRLHGGRLPQAVICVNDQVAVGVCQAAEEAGFRVPQDLLVTGFDNLNISAYLTPSITTVDQMSWMMGETCINTLLRIWRGEDVPRVVNTPTELLLRESTGHGDTRQEDLKSHVSEFIRRDSDSTEFGYKLSTMQYQLPGCESVEEICLALARCISALNCKGVRLVLDRELYQYGGRFDFNERVSRTDAGGDRMSTEGYSKTMEMVFYWDAGKEPQFPRSRVGSTLNAEVPVGPRENHLFVPLHFMEYTVGYLSIWNCIDMMHIRCVSSIANTFTMALRSYFASSKLAYVNQMLSGISMQDGMTGLYNRLGYHNMAPRLFNETHDAGGRLGILFIDMDKLKHINDSYGHASGDQAILCISNAILRSVREDALPVRYGGDEFLVITPIEGEEALRELIDAILKAIPREARILGVTDVPGISTGYVLTDPEAVKTLNEYVEEADSLMYADKKARQAER